jgi:hypothetical protein
MTKTVTGRWPFSWGQAEHCPPPQCHCTRCVGSSRLTASPLVASCRSRPMAARTDRSRSQRRTGRWLGARGVAPRGAQPSTIARPAQWVCPFASRGCPATRQATTSTTAWGTRCCLETRPSCDMEGRSQVSSVSLCCTPKLYYVPSALTVSYTAFCHRVYNGYRMNLSINSNYFLNRVS